MKAPTLLTLALTLLVWLGASAQTTFPEDTATPALEAATEPIAAPPVPPSVPQLQPLAPVTGPIPTPGKGFPFHHEDSPIQFSIDTDHDGKTPKSEDAQMLELFLPIAITGIVFFCPVLIIGIILIYRQRKNRLLHQTIQGFVEKGQPIPPELLSNGGKPLPTKNSDRRRGLMLTCIGGGLILFFLVNGNDSWGIGFIPFGIGIGYLLTSKFAPRGVDHP